MGLNQQRRDLSNKKMTTPKNNDKNVIEPEQVGIWQSKHMISLTQNLKEVNNYLNMGDPFLWAVG